MTDQNESEPTGMLIVPDDITAMLKTLPKHLIQKISLRDIDLITKPFRLWNAELKQQIEELQRERDEAMRQRDSYYTAMRTEYQDLVRERDEAIAQRDERQKEFREAINIIFDGPPSHESGRFVEVENDAGASISIGEWIERDDGLWALRIEQAYVDALERTERKRDELRKAIENAPHDIECDSTGWYGIGESYEMDYRKAKAELACNCWKGDVTE